MLKKGGIYMRQKSIFEKGREKDQKESRGREKTRSQKEQGKDARGQCMQLCMYLKCTVAFLTFVRQGGEEPIGRKR